MKFAHRIELGKEIFGDRILQEVGVLIKILTCAGYGCYVWEDEFVVCIDYDYRNPEFCEVFHYWLDEDEATAIDNMRNGTIE